MGKSENYLFIGNYCSLGSQNCLKHLALLFSKLFEAFSFVVVVVVVVLLFYIHGEHLRSCPDGQLN